MARGDITFFDQYLEEREDGAFDTVNDTIKAMIVTDTTITYTDNDPKPSTFTEVAWTGYAQQTLSITTNDATRTVSATDITWSSNGSGGSDGAYIVVYNDTDANDRAMFTVSLLDSDNNTTGNLNKDLKWICSGGIYTY